MVCFDSDLGSSCTEVIAANSFFPEMLISCSMSDSVGKGGPQWKTLLFLHFGNYQFTLLGQRKVTSLFSGDVF